MKLTTILVNIFLSLNHLPPVIAQEEKLAPVTCPSGWISYKQSCFAQTGQRATWAEAQKLCNMKQANLASILNEDEFNLVTSSFRTAKVWIGLNDLAEPGSLSWIDDATEMDQFMTKKLALVQSQPDKHCVALLLSNGRLAMVDCEQMKQFAICLIDLSEPFDPYPIPDPWESSEDYGDGGAEESSGEDNTQAILLGIFIPVVGLVILLVIAVFVRKKRLAEEEEAYNNEKRIGQAGINEQESNEGAAIPSAPPQGVYGGLHPPSYEDALSGK